MTYKNLKKKDSFRKILIEETGFFIGCNYCGRHNHFHGHCFPGT